MIARPDATHDPALRSWVTGADGHPDFPIQNLPLCVLQPAGEAPRGAIAIGDHLLDLGPSLAAGLCTGADAALLATAAGPTLAPWLALGADDRRRFRALVSALLATTAPAATRAAARLVPQAGATHALPVPIRDYTDFYASIDHATNVGTMLRPDNPLLPNYKWVPIGYHGRASTIVPSGTPIHRPRGQLRDGEQPPTYAPTRRLDYELELGLFAAGTPRLGDTIPISSAPQRLAGICLLNDWSARDVQAWEYQPLGPFLAKSFATSISPFLVTMEALAPFRAPAAARPAGDPAPLPYLDDADDQAHGALDITVEAWLASSAMREGGHDAVRLSQGNARRLYWTPAQLLAHHASNGCDVGAGDLLGTGTISGPTREERGCLLELTWRGAEPVTLPGGETRTFLADGDELTITGFCEREGFARIGLGRCVGRIVPAA